MTHDFLDVAGVFAKWSMALCALLFLHSIDESLKLLSGRKWDERAANRRKL